MSHLLKNIAILIDADNTPISLIDEILSKAESFGQIGIKKIYGDWGSDHLKSWQSVILSHAIMPVHQFAYTKGKNATDISMVIDAMDLVLENVYDGFCLVSSDSDFAPLAARLRANKIKVFGFGKPNTPDSFQKACDEFICFQVPAKAEPEKNSPKQASKKSTENNIKPIPQKVKARILKAIDENIDQNGWTALSHIVSAIRNEDSTFSPKKYGFGKYPTLLKNIPEVEIKPQGSNYICRRKNGMPIQKEENPLPNEIKSFLLADIQQFVDKTGWVRMGIIGGHLKTQYPNFNYKNYGFSRFSDLLRHFSEIKCKKEGSVDFCALKKITTGNKLSAQKAKKTLNPSQILQETMILLKNSPHKKGWVSETTLKNHLLKLDPTLTLQAITAPLEQSTSVQCLIMPNYGKEREKYYRKIPFLKLVEQLKKVSQRTDINIRDSHGRVLACALGKYSHFHVHYGKYGYQSFHAFFNQVIEYYKRKKANAEHS